MAAALPTAGGPASGAGALGAYALPGAGAGISGQTSAAAGALVAGRDVHAGRAVRRDVAANIDAAGGHNAVSHLDAETDALYASLLD